MRVEVKHEGGYWSVYIDGQRLVDRESFAVADHVRNALECPRPTDHSESAEVAEEIRRHLRR